MLSMAQTCQTTHPQSTRLERARYIAVNSKIYKVHDEGRYWVESATSEKFYDVELKCSCPDYAKRGKVCKHIGGVVIKFGSQD